MVNVVIILSLLLNLNAYAVDTKTITSEGQLLMTNTTDQTMRVFLGRIDWDRDLVSQFVIFPRETIKLPITYGAGDYRIERYVRHDKDYEEFDEFEFSIANPPATKIVYTADSYYTKYNDLDDLRDLSDTLIQKSKSESDYIDRSYKWVITNIKYDWRTLRRLESGQLKDYRLDMSGTLDTKSGICQEYAGIFASLLRIQGIPARVVHGETARADWGNHAWVEISQEGSWIIYDPTLECISHKKLSAGYIPHAYY